MTSGEDETPRRKTAKELRDERLQAQLRENLKRRKEQARGRRGVRGDAASRGKTDED